MNNYAGVTVGVIAYNEQRYLPELLSNLYDQTYPKEHMEIILVDGESDDKTWEIMSNFQQAHSNEYRKVCLCHNYKRIQAAGWNIVFQLSTSEIVIRVDAHAKLPADFIAKNVACIESGEDVCGGPRENIVDDDSFWKQLLLHLEKSLFGSGIASYRQEVATKKYVSSVFHGAYRKEVIDKVGLFNENLLRTEDNEYHYRVRKQGYRICYDPSIKSYYQTRNTFRGMLKQKYQNGYWIGMTSSVCPQCLSWYHFVPMAFVICLALSFMLLVAGMFFPFLAICFAYFAFCGLTTFDAIKKLGFHLLVLFIPVMLFSLHIAYGLGTLKGIKNTINFRNSIAEE